MMKGTLGMPKMSPCIHIDFDKDAKEVKGFAVGDEVTVVIKGTIRGVEQRESYDDPKKLMASVSLKDYEVRIGKPKENIFDALENEDEEQS